MSEAGSKSGGLSDERVKAAAKREAEQLISKTLTRYVILQRVIHLAGTDLGKVLDVDMANTILEAEEHGIWVPIGDAEARTPSKAIEVGAKNRAGIFKAIPLRSWRGGEERKAVTEVTSLPFNDWPEDD